MILFPTGAKVFNRSVIFQQDITVEEFVQTINLTELNEWAVKLSEGRIDVEGQLVFQSPVTVSISTSKLAYTCSKFEIELTSCATGEEMFQL